MRSVVSSEDLVPVTIRLFTRTITVYLYTELYICYHIYPWLPLLKTWKAKNVETDLFFFLKYLNKIEMRLLEICPAKNTFFLDKKIWEYNF